MKKKQKNNFAYEIIVFAKYKTTVGVYGNN